MSDDDSQFITAQAVREWYDTGWFSKGHSDMCIVPLGGLTLVVLWPEQVSAIIFAVPPELTIDCSTSLLRLRNHFLGRGQVYMAV